MQRPVFFVHTGKQYYLKRTVRQAEKYCSRVILLGEGGGMAGNLDIASESYDQFEYLTDSRWQEFVKVFKYLSSGSERYELAWFRRYFVIHEFMRRNKIESAVMVDSDEMLYTDLCKFDFGDYDVALALIPSKWEYAWSVCPSVMYFKFAALENIIDYFIEVYSCKSDIFNKKIEAHKRDNVKGGIIDMTLLYLWNKNQKRYKVYDFYEDRYDGWFDTNMGGDDYGRFIMAKHPFGMMKKIIQKNHKLYFIDTEGKDKLVYGLHLQGGKKAYIPALYSGHFTEPGLTISYIIYHYLVGIITKIRNWILTL